ncbi:MAG: VOC family protein [Desulfuromonadaceae bacterium]|nr:VOC family protein [Desulfuromonadaceae bacterium]
MNVNPVGWFEIYVQDMVRAKAFYEAVLKTQLEPLVSHALPELEMWSFPAQPDRWGAGGALARLKGVPSGGNSTLVYFSCEDCANEVSRVIAAGGQIDRDKFSIGQYGYIALVVDTEGNMIGLHSLT